MSINSIRSYIKSNLGKTFSFRFKGSRNQIDEFIGKIVGVYHSIFTIEVVGREKRIKSYSYNDVLIENLEIKEFMLKK